MNNTVIAIPRSIIPDAEVNGVTVQNAVFHFIHSPAFRTVVDKIVEINNNYGNSWQQDGIFISLGDIKDKLTRCEVVVSQGKLNETQKTQDNYGNVIFDLFVRSLLLMIWDENVKKHLRDKYGINVDEQEKIMGET